MSFLKFDLIFVSVLDILDHYIYTLSIQNKNTYNMAVLILELFLYQSHLSKYNSFKLAAFALDLANLLICNEHTEIKYIINQ